MDPSRDRLSVVEKGGKDRGRETKSDDPSESSRVGGDLEKMSTTLR